MDYEEKIRRMDEHLKEHPKDYQTVISRMKTASAYVDHERQKVVNARLKRLAEIRKERKERLNAERTQQ